MADRSVETFASRLEDTTLDAKSKAAVAIEVRDNIESWSQSNLYVTFLARFVPICLKLLSGTPQFWSASPEQRLRNCLLETLHRLPLQLQEPLAPYVGDIADKLMELINVDNEENAIICVKTVMDLFRHHSKTLGSDKIQIFLDIIKQLFESTDRIVRETFGPGTSSGPHTNTSAVTGGSFSSSPRPGSPAVVPSDANQEQQQARPLIKGVQSFKLLSECPIAVVSIFQALPRDAVTGHVETYMPHVKGILLSQVPAQEKAHEIALKENRVHIGPARDIKNKIAYGDFITAQVKTMSFLAFILRLHGQRMTDFLPTLPNIVVRILRDCPREKCAIRKELLVAVRHVINFNFRKIFLKSINDLLDERTLLGDSLTVEEAVKPLAYSVLADLIHHVRDSLSIDQIRKTVTVFRKNLRLETPGTSFQTMSAKLLMNMAPCIAKLEDKREARYFLVSILDAIGDTFAAMNRQYPNAVKISSQSSDHGLDINTDEYWSISEQPPHWDETDIFTTSPIKIVTPRERALDPVYDNKFHFKNLVFGLKGVFYELRACNPPELAEISGKPANWSEVACGFSAEEVHVLIKLFHEGIQVFQYYEGEKPPSESNLAPVELLASHHATCSKDEKELLESFATVFHHVDPAAFHEIFHSEIPHVYRMMFKHPALLQVPQFLLASEATSPSFAGMLLQFLMERIEDIGSSDVDTASILLRLFKLSFMAVTLFSTSNEQVLLPHVNTLVTKSIKLSTKAQTPMHYFYLLRSLFRSIGGGRFEHLYKEIQALLEMLLEVLNSLISSARNNHERELYVELSLTVPARLSNLLPHLSYLMRPLVLALRAGNDLVGQGLRTLELCVDNLTADYLDPIMAPVIDDLMSALWDHLKPNPYNPVHAHTTMRILGKLGGRNRKFLDGPPSLSFEKFSDDSAAFDIRFIGCPGASKLPAKIGVQLAISKIQEPVPKDVNAQAKSLFYKRKALSLIKSHISLLLGVNRPPHNFQLLVRSRANDLASDEPQPRLQEDLLPSARHQSKSKCDEQQTELKNLLKAFVYASSTPELSDEAKTFTQSCYEHFALLEISQALAESHRDPLSFSIGSGEGEMSIDHRVLVDVIVECLASDKVEVRSQAEEAVIAFREALMTIFGSRDKISRIPFFPKMMMTCCHACYAEEWFTKSGGALGISILLEKINFDSLWLQDKQLEICRALMYTAKDVPEELPEGTRKQALDALTSVIKICNTEVSAEDAVKPSGNFHNVCSFFALELSHTSRHVRQAAQDAFAELARMTHTQVHEIVAPVKERLLSHVFNKPLRALPYAIQIAYIEAVTYCIKLQNGILESNDLTARFIRESSLLAEHDQENSLHNRPPDQRNVENVSRLKVACLKLLSAALDFNENQSSPNNSFRARHRAIGIFFKLLRGNHPDVVETAYHCLKSACDQDTKLPKDVLQGGLRPILYSLQNHTTLGVDSLDCLSRLLQILKNYFKVEIGLRLLENIRLFVPREALQKASFQLIEQHDKINVAAGIFNLFHLLPPSAANAMETVIKKALELEKDLRRTHFSPFRAPILKFLNRYPELFWQNFCTQHIEDREQGRFVAQAIADETATPIRDAVSAEFHKLLDHIDNESNDQGSFVAVINTMDIVSSMCRYPSSAASLLADKRTRKILLARGKAIGTALRSNKLVDTDLRLAAEQAGDRLIFISTTYLSQNSADIDCLLEVINGAVSGELRDTSDILTYLYHHIICSQDVKLWRHLLNRCLDIFTSRTQSEYLKAYVFQKIVNPILAMDVMRNWETLHAASKGTDLVDKGLIDLFQTRLWKPQSNIDPQDDATPPGIDQSRIELLQTTALLLKYHSNMMQDARKDVIKFHWTYIRLDDAINKHAAYVNLAYFVAAFETPSKIVTQIYGALIGAHVNESRPLVIQALEILAPVIPKRIGGGEGKIPLWAKLARKPIVEDPSNLAQMLSVLHFVARHPDLFYEAKEIFAQIIIPSIHKVAQLPTPSIENKKMALSLLTLIESWEKRHASEALGAQETTSSSEDTVMTERVDLDHMAPVKPASFITSTALRFMLLKYLVQFIASLPDRYPVASAAVRDPGHRHAAQAAQAAEIAMKAMNLFVTFLSPPFWTDLDIDAMFPKVTEHILLSDPKPDEKFDAGYTRVINTLRLVRAMVNLKPDTWVMARLPQLQKLLEKPLRSAHPEVQDCLYSENARDKISSQPLVKRILEAIPTETSEEESSDAETASAEFMTTLNSIVTETYAAGNNLAGTNVLAIFAECRPAEIDRHAATVMKALGQCLKDHLPADGVQQNPASAAPGMRSSDAANVSQAGSNANELQVQLILKILKLLAVRIVELGENRRPYLTTLTTLIEKSPSKEICLEILNLVNTWIFDSPHSFPTLKEKNAVIIKMSSFERRTDPTLFNRFLDLVIRIYEDPQIMRSELVIRLEPAFLTGTRTSNVEMRTRFMKLFDQHLSRTATSRMLYLLAQQNWDSIGDDFWLSQVIQLMLGCVELNQITSLGHTDFEVRPVSSAFSHRHQDSRVDDVMVDDKLETLIDTHLDFCTQVSNVRAKNLIDPLLYLQHTDDTLATDLWAAIFPIVWSAMSKEQRAELQGGMIALMTKEYHARLLDRRPNCIQALLEGITRTQNPRMNFPHHLVKYLARMYNGWYTAMSFMEQSAVEPVVNTASVRESNLDALAEVYADLSEEDLFYGLWRRRSQFLMTNTALSYEQIGQWDKGQRTFESATFKARTGEVPFSQSEYMLWEDHWVLCAQKLQQWDILSDFAKVDSLNDLYLDAVWRQFEKWESPESLKHLDSIIRGISDAPTPRRLFYQSFMSLLKLHANQETAHGFHRICDESIQLSIRKWHQLPRRITNAHVPILQNFQQLVEMHDASVICASLKSTDSNNLDHKAPELKLLLGTWRDRLPNFWDDINAWQDLVTWRRHIFRLVNDKYLSLIPAQQGTATGNSYAFRGHHEIAWTINKFAHVARKHHLPEVCINYLSTIYTLPNIEIQEAFLKLREQAKCHYQNPAELQVGLDVINNTNLNYFGQQQKAEFYTLKGMFLAKQHQMEEANEAFGSALYFDLKLPKAWAEWARYNEQLYKEDPTDITKAAAAISCYLEAAGCYKSAKSRKALSRVLWLLSLDNADGTLAQTFEDYKGDTPVWYWTTFIPQLLNSISRLEGNISRSILIKVAKQYPQALYFHLRTSKEDYSLIRKQQEAKARSAKPGQGSPPPSQGTPTSRPGTADNDANARPGTSSSDRGSTTEIKIEGNNVATGRTATPQPQSSPGTKVEGQEQKPSAQSHRPSQSQPWEHLEEISSVLKTAFPLLTLSMESMIEQIARHFKCAPDEEAYRLINALFNDALGYVARVPKAYSSTAKIQAGTKANVARFSDSILPPHLRVHFEKDFLKEDPDMITYLSVMRKWRDKFEEKLDRRAAFGNLEAYGPFLSEFKFQKFDEVEVPGQYLLHKDKNQDFVRIERLLPDIDMTRGNGVCYKKLKMRGHDGSVHCFSVQHPAPRTCRREERMIQMLRFFNDILAKRKETRRRKIQFTLPVIVPLTPAVRMVSDDSSYVTLQSIFDDHCRKKRLPKDEAVLFIVEKLRELDSRSPEVTQQIRVQLFEAVQSKWAPNTIVHDYFAATHPSFADFWLFRRQVSYQLAALSFMTYTMLMKDRNPTRMSFSRGTGNVWGSDLAPSMAPAKPIFHNNEHVPFRLTPNLQMLMGPIALEGIFSASILVIAKALTEPNSTESANNGQTAAGANSATGTNNAAPSQTSPVDSSLEQQLSVFIRDEVFWFYTINHRGTVPTAALREHVQANGDLIVKRALALAEPPPGPLPAGQTVIDQISKAVNPHKLAQMDPLWAPWL
ncbi:MAG: hypothetical protein M1828_002081 [Chrysothrix sp. TS-e1954]|nr:MAG: hypothetical protein M1828_002081 [Chrysothrix sp. TS-e1954]